MRLNPLLTNELRLRMRSWRSFATVSLYLLALGGFATFFYAGYSRSFGLGYMDPSALGQGLFAFITGLQFVLIYFVVPGLTAGLVSGERERQTFDLLVCTQLRPAGIVAGKLFSTLSTVFLLVLASLPLYSVVFLLGGVSPEQLAIVTAILMITALIYGSHCLLISALLKKTTVAVVAAYALCLFLLGGTLLAVGLYNALLLGYQQSSLNYLLLLLNPLALFEWLFPDLVGDLLGGISGGSHYPTFWQLSLIVNGALAFLSFFFATRLVNPLRAGKRSG